MRYDVGDIITIGKGKRRKMLKVIAVTEQDSAGRVRTHTQRRRKRKGTSR